MKFDEFMGKCTACGGNWTQVIMTGIKEVAPDVYEQMPDRTYEFDEVAFIANHLCHDRPHFRFNRCWNGEIIEHDSKGNFVFRRATEVEMNMTVREFELRYNAFDMEKQIEKSALDCTSEF